VPVVVVAVCPSCAERARILRAAQCREGWHLDREPVIDPDPVTEEQRTLVTDRAEAQEGRDLLASAGVDTGELDEQIEQLDEEITDSGLRGTVMPARPRRHRSTRRRQDAAPLPRRPVSARTVGKTYTAPDGKTFRPSLFVTLTCPSYGRVGEGGVPADPDTYGYARAARDALHFAALFDRFIQNLRRYVGYDLQYFAAIEPQRRLAPHVHLAIRGTISRAELREVIAATYHQVWWPTTQAVRYEGRRLPVWDEHACTYLDPDTGEVLPTWDQALDAIGDQDEPLHVARFGARFDAQGVLAGSRDASRCIGYLTKYLTKHIGECHQADSDAQAAHAARLADALRYEPCSPTCANWLRYGIQPKNARPGLRPGCCKGKAHRREYLGYAGRRVLVSRKWSGETLADHRADRRTWLTSALGLPATHPRRYTWEAVKPGDPDHMPTGNGSCTSSPTASNGKPPSTWPGAEPPKPIFRQLAGRHDGQSERRPLGRPVRWSPGPDSSPASGQVAGHQPGGCVPLRGRSSDQASWPPRLVVSAKLREFIETEGKAA
jgi:hypothetical protein